jgi:hypothetical protein
MAAVNFLSMRLAEYRANRWVSNAPSLGHASRATLQRRVKGADMLAWLLWQLERMERIRAVAGALMTEFGADAYAEARRREREAKGAEMAGDWRRVALAVARQTSVSGDRDAVEPSPPPELAPHAEPPPIVSEQPTTFRIQFVCRTLDHDLTNLMEKQIQVADTPAAIIAAASIKWPPQTIGVRILDRQGHEVFARQRAQRG